MEVASAILLIETIVYKPDWRFSATDHTNRFEGAILVRVDYPAFNTNRDQAPDYGTKIDTYASEPLIVSDCGSDVDLFRLIFRQIIQKIELHESREAFRIRPTMWAPFHPHRRGGMVAWGDVEADLKFGLG